MGTQDYIQTRIEALGEFNDGWDGSGSIAPPPGLLDWLAEVLPSELPDDLPTAYIYPIRDGHVQIEWEIGPWELDLEIGCDITETITYLGTWDAFSTQSEMTITGDLAPMTPPVWRYLVLTLRWMMEDGA